MSAPSHVRLALPAESSAIAAVQQSAWASDQVLAKGFDQIGLNEVVQIWHRLIVAPPLALFRVLVALENDQVVGFALIGPNDDADAQPTDGLVHEFVIAPGARRQGHGSRLMQAAVETMQLDGFEQASWWVTTTDDVLREYLIESGWAPDGAHRQLTTEDESAHLKQIRMSTRIS